MWRDTPNVELKEMLFHGHWGDYARAQIYNTCLEVDPVKIDVVSKLPLPFNIKSLQSFLGHAGFYRRLIKWFSQIVMLLSSLLSTNQAYVFLWKI